MSSTLSSPSPLPVPSPAPVPLAQHIRDVPFPLPLAERLDPSIPVLEFPNTLSPSEELHYPPDISSGMVTPTFSEESKYTDQDARDAAKPQDYVIYNCHLENHVKYGKKIMMPSGEYKYPHYLCFDHDYVDHKHNVFGLRKDMDRQPYGWTLEAAPFMGPCPSPLIADSDNYAPFTNSYCFHKEVDIVLYAEDDPGLIADVNWHCTLKEEERQLAH
jgi:hypothetical protein